MVRLSRFTFTLTLVFALLLLAVRLGIGRRETSRFSLLFTNPDGSLCQRPCLFGIRLEGMTYKQVWSMLESHPVLQSRRFGGGISSSYTAGDLITDLDIAYGYGVQRPTLYTFGDVINVLGPPSHAAFISATGCVDLYFARQQLIISNWATGIPLCDGSHFDVDDRVHGIELFDQDQFMLIPTLKPWHGFGDPQQYASP